MDLNVVWFALIFVLFTGFFVLEGFDFGVGILLPFLGKDDRDRRVIINTIGPHWDGNEVWVLAAGGAIFAAFPHWYATMFSGLYLALVLMLLVLIGRAVSFEFRSKDRHPIWRKLWDWIIFGSSVVLALLWGIVFSGLVRGLPIDATMQYTGGFWDLFHPYALVGGLATFFAFTLHGAVFLSLKTHGELQTRAATAAQRLWFPAVVAIFGYLIYGYFATDMFTKQGVIPIVLSIGAAVALLASGWFVWQKRSGWAFVLTVLTIALSTIMLATGLYPRVMVSSLNAEWSLDIYTASSSPYTLRIMTIVALIFLPIILIYQGWSYWVFRQRIGRKDELEY